MPKPTNPELYESVKKKMKKKYNSKRSPFLSGAIVNEYKKQGGTYENDGKEQKLKRWFDEKWVNINPLVGVKNEQAYGFFRPTVKISNKTPTLAQDISRKELRNLVIDKQTTKYGKNVKDEIIGGMIVKAQPYSKDNFTTEY